MKIQSLLVVFVTLALGACATSYQAKSFTGGFSETQLDQNVWTVTFKGNGYTSMERATDFTLLRSADLALQNGFGYFVIAEKGQAIESGAFTTPTQTTTTGSATLSGNTVYGQTHSTTYGGQTFIFHKPSTSNTIICFKERPQNVQGMVYDANFLKNSISQKYHM